MLLLAELDGCTHCRSARLDGKPACRAHQRISLWNAKWRKLLGLMTPSYDPRYLAGSTQCILKTRGVFGGSQDVNWELNSVLFGPHSNR